MRLCFKRKMPWFVIGGGSNVLVGDGGMRGIVIRLGGGFAASAACAVEDDDVVVEAGASAAWPPSPRRRRQPGRRASVRSAGIPGNGRRLAAHERGNRPRDGRFRARRVGAVAGQAANRTRSPSSISTATRRSRATRSSRA